MSLMLSSQFESAFSQLKEQLPSSVLLYGERGVGLLTIARKLSMSAGEVHIIEPVLLTKTSTLTRISVEHINALYEQTRSRHRKHRIVIIDDADKMTEAAQNAFLKLLEEPPVTTRFILTSHRPEQLLPTIRSRVQRYHVSLVDESQLRQLLNNEIDSARIRQLLFLAGGRPAEMMRLQQDQRYFKEAAERVTLAKQAVSNSGYSNALLIIRAKFTRLQAISFIEAVLQLLERQSDKHSLGRIAPLLKALEDIHHGGNVTLQLIRAMV